MELYENSCFVRSINPGGSRGAIGSMTLARPSTSLGLFNSLALLKNDQMIAARDHLICKHFRAFNLAKWIYWSPIADSNDARYVSITLFARTCVDVCSWFPFSVTYQLDNNSINQVFIDRADYKDSLFFFSFPMPAPRGGVIVKMEFPACRVQPCNLPTSKDNRHRSSPFISNLPFRQA